MKGTSSRAKATAPYPTTSGCCAGVKTFYVDEEHSKLPTNQRVLNALTELIETGDQKTEDNLWKDIGPEFAGDRGVGEESQATMLAAESSRRAARQQQATMLSASLQSRGDLSGQTVSTEEQALSDLIYLRDPLPLQVSGSRHRHWHRIDARCWRHLYRNCDDDRYRAPHRHSRSCVGAEYRRHPTITCTSGGGRHRPHRLHRRWTLLASQAHRRRARYRCRNIALLQTGSARWSACTSRRC